MQSFWVSIQFLTRLPVHIDEPTAEDIRRSYFFYPIVGAVIGTAAGLMRWGAGLVLPESVSIVLVLSFLVWITGGLHEDGLADVADGMSGGWTAERRLEIMKDSPIGTFGTLALLLILLGKYSILIAMNPNIVFRALVAGQLLGRWAFLPMGYFNVPARAGLGASFCGGLNLSVVVSATALTLAAVIALHGFIGLIALIFATIIVGVASIYFRKRIGGITGDCLGATFQFGEVITYAVFLA